MRSLAGFGIMLIMSYLLTPPSMRGLPGKLVGLLEPVGLVLTEDQKPPTR